MILEYEMWIYICMNITDVLYNMFFLTFEVTAIYMVVKRLNPGNSHIYMVVKRLKPGHSHIYMYIWLLYIYIYTHTHIYIYIWLLKGLNQVTAIYIYIHMVVKRLKLQT